MANIGSASARTHNPDDALNHNDEIQLSRFDTSDGRDVRKIDSNSLDVPENAALIEDIPPNGGYGWVCTACMFMINAHTWGINSAWGVFLAHYLADSTFPGASHLEYALIGGLSISMSLISSPVVAVLNRKFGTHITLIIGTVLVFVSLFAASFATQIWHLFLTQGAVFGWGMGCLYLPASSVLPQWFSTHRSLAVGISASGAGFGGLAYNLVAGKAIQTLGLGWTYRVLAICSLVANLVFSLLLKDRNKTVKPKLTSFDIKEYTRVEVLLVSFWGVLTELGYIALYYSLPNYANSIGLTATQGSVVNAVLSLGLALARPVIGYYSDSFGRINMATLMTALCGVFCLAIWVPAKTYPVLLVFALLVGAVCGTFWGTVTAVTAEVVGLQRLPISFGMICLLLVLPTTFAEPIALQMVQSSGYLTTQLFVGFMFLLAAGCTWLLRSWKLNEIEKKGVNERETNLPNQPPPRRRDHDYWLSLRRLFYFGKV